MAEALRSVLRKLATALERPAYNLILQSGPLREHGLPHAHWHIEVLPILAMSAGFEAGARMQSIPSRRKSRPRSCGKCGTGRAFTLLMPF